MVMALALALALAGAGADQTPLQLMAGPHFEALLKGVAGACPDREDAVRHTFPANLLDVEDGVTTQLGPGRRARVKRQVKAAGCTDGAACAANAELHALMKVGASETLVHAVCAKPVEAWR